MGKNNKIIKEYILEYLNHNFMVRDKHVYSNETKDKAWAYDVITELVDVYGFLKDDVSAITKDWIESRGVDWNDWNTLRKIRATWTPELVQDISACCGIDVTQELEQMLIKEVSEQMNSQIIANITNFQDLERKMMEIGYKVETSFDPMDFVPRRQFVLNENNQ
jgi:hypothetical protein